ncbi:PKD domain-containing protein [Dactylosporangium sp. CA-233914]|uniref:YVTN family beta-propeller repeat protein n=1 Tax=Dactylosporangium sp. CA-233914 TaxID=3239934 RepID=UPI003D949AA4
MHNRILTAVTTTVVTVGAALTVGAQPGAAAMIPRTVIYVAGVTPSTTTVLDEATGKDLNTIEAGGGAGEIAFTPGSWDGAFISDEAFDRVIPIGTYNSRRGDAIAVGHQPHGLVFLPDATALYVANWGSDTVSFINDTNAVAATISVAHNPHGVAVAPDGKHVYVTTEAGVQVIDTAANKVSTTVAVGTRPYGITIAPDGKRAYVTNWGADSVSVLDLATNTVTATVTVGGKPYDVAVTPDGKYVYVTSNTLGAVVAVDTATNAVIATIPAGAHPCGIDIAPDGKHAYVTGLADNNVRPIDLTTNTAATPIPIGHGALGIAVGVVVSPSAPYVSLWVPEQTDQNSIGVDARGSTPGLARAVSYTYDYGDGTTETRTSPEPVTQHVYAHGGRYTVSVTLTDAAGVTRTASKTAFVHPFLKTFSLLSLSNMRYVSAEAQGEQPLVANRASGGSWESYDLLDYGAGQVALRARANNRYVTVDGSARLAATSYEPVAFDLVPGANGVFSLRYQGRYVSTNNGAGPLTADRTAAGPWEQFAGAVSTNRPFTAKIRTYNYITAEAGGAQPLIANRYSFGPWETFDVIDAGDGWIALLSHANYRFVTAEDGGNRPLIANRTTVGGWERFKLTTNADGTRSLLAGANNRYVSAEAAGTQPLIANRTQVGAWELFGYL